MTLSVCHHGLIVFAKVFFDTSDPGSASLKAFATFAIGFIARPLVGLFFGLFSRQ
jgi:hypothetical protein